MPVCFSQAPGARPRQGRFQLALVPEAFQATISAESKLICVSVLLSLGTFRTVSYMFFFRLYPFFPEPVQHSHDSFDRLDVF